MKWYSSFWNKFRFEYLFSPQNGYGFKANGGSQYVDLGNWTNETCFVDIEQCKQGNAQLEKTIWFSFLESHRWPMWTLLFSIWTSFLYYLLFVGFTLMDCVNIITVYPYIRTGMGYNPSGLDVPPPPIRTWMAVLPPCGQTDRQVSNYYLPAYFLLGR